MNYKDYARRYIGESDTNCPTKNQSKINFYSRN